MNIQSGNKIGILKKFNDFFTTKTLGEYLLENNDRYLKEIEKMQPGDGEIYIVNRNESKSKSPNVTSTLAAPKIQQNGVEIPTSTTIKDREKLTRWEYFNGYNKEIYYINRKYIPL